MGGRLGGSKKDRWRAQAELQGILGAGTRLVRLGLPQVIYLFLDAMRWDPRRIFRSFL